MTDFVEPLAVEDGQPDEAEWEQAPCALRRESEAPVLSVDGFEGPLDWLLELVRTHRLDLSRLSIVALVEAFAAALEQALQQGSVRQAASSLSRWADWLVMAATLTQLRARLILPTSTPEAQAAIREADELRRQLLSRRHIQAAADWLERRQQLGLQVWARGRSEQGVAGVPGEGGDLAELMRACLVALALPDQLAEAYRLPPHTLWPVPVSIARIRERLAVLPDGSALVAFLPDLKVEEVGGFRARSAVASTFAASLELARDGQLTLNQEEALQAILVSRHDAGGCHERPRTLPTLS
ncbi:segregation and condensation protein A [Lichenicoccus roseus]|uniref:Segregation and condensation protein A n=1 Tax=Lichenicoccus roseus TaxID=2683649 RepID=A0A5R9J2L7_9PROT|nr:ScpA family protein [Lichenicoccus roseus]TLU70727.1 segregation/condensation protein A [Lichenicoccus roseus]